MKKFLIFLVLILFNFSFSQAFVVDNILYNVIASGEVEVQYSYVFSGVVVIPSTVVNGTTYTVKKVGNNAFGSSAITSITLPNSVTSIDIAAFNNCTSLTSVSLGNSITSIGYNAFQYCSALTSITLPNSVTSLGTSAFEQCTSLTSVTLGNSLTQIGASTFEQCTSLTSVTVPNSLSSIGNSAFLNCSFKKVIMKWRTEIKMKLTNIQIVLMITLFKMPNL
jgi:hypothetical protein